MAPIAKPSSHNKNYAPVKSPHCDYDIAVIGAGPAGSLAAALASEAGFSVALIDKAAFPRFKPCGGLISSRAIALLPENLQLPEAFFSPVEKIAVVKGKRCWEFNAGKRLGLIAERSVFDHLLVKYAQSCGASLLEQHRIGAVDYLTGNKKESAYRLRAKAAGKADLSARFVIGACGALTRQFDYAGLIGKQTMFKGQAVMTSVNSLANEKSDTAYFYPLPRLGGMGWAFSGQGWINRGVGGLANLKSLKKAYYGLFSDNRASAKLRAWPLPYGGPLQKVAVDNLMLIGDAAGIVDPFSGEGLYNSFTSARLAVAALIEAKRENVAAGNIYSRLFRQYFRRPYPAALLIPVMMHATSIINPAALPRAMAGLMSRHYRQGPKQ